MGSGAVISMCTEVYVENTFSPFDGFLVILSLPISSVKRILTYFGKTIASHQAAPSALRAPGVVSVAEKSLGLPALSLRVDFLAG